MQIIFRSVVVLCALCIVAAYAFGVDVSTLPRLQTATTFLDRNGAPLGTILASDANHATAVPLRAMSPHLARAMIAAEDARFAEHGAVDLRGLLRAVREVVVYGTFRSGGSTIAMQLARLLHPSPGTLRGKAVQILVAERIAMRSEKPAVLEAYLNRAPMGGNLYGVESAARTYFGGSASDLDLAQAALIAALPNDPSNLAPDEHLDAAQVRQKYILERMVSLGFITQPEAEGAIEERLHVARHDSGIGDAAHALFYLYPQMHAQQRVRTTIDRGLQRFVQAQVQQVVDGLSGRHVTDGAALVIDNRTGDVLAYVGSPDYFSDAALGRNDGVQALRQPGSTLKPFTYERALETGAITPTTILQDVPSSFALQNGQLYEPADYSGSFSGPVRVRYALANSLNVPAVRVLSMIGPDALLDRLHALGFTHLDKPASYYGLGLTLGGGEVSLWENVRAYVALARGGRAIPLRLMNQAAHVTVIGNEPMWSLITNMLADPHARVHSFGNHSVLDMPFDAAVKTGTSSDFRDTWTIGFTRDYTVGTWVGNFDGSAMHGISGVSGAGPLWNRIMLHLHERREPPRFDAPPGFTSVAICATTGHAPLHDCPAVVNEYVKPANVGAVLRPVRATLSSLTILEPRDGATFYYHAPQNGLQARSQMIALRAGGANDVSWFANGTAVPADSAGTAFLSISPGAYTIEARAHERRDTVHILVAPAPAQARPGFSISSKPSKLK